MPSRRRLRAYFAGSRVLALYLTVIALAVIAADLAAEVIVPRALPRDGGYAGSILGGLLGITRGDDARPFSTVAHFLVWRWPFFLFVLAGVLLPLATHLRGYGRAMVVALGLGAGGSLANLLALAAGGVVHNWLALTLPGGSPMFYSLGDLAQGICFSMLVALAFTYLLDTLWLHPRALLRRRPVL